MAVWVWALQGQPLGSTPPGLGWLAWPGHNLCTRSPSAHARPDFHLVRIQCNIAEQDNIDLQSHILGRVVWLLSQDNRVEWGFPGVVHHVGQSYSEGQIIQREGSSILYTHIITLGVHTQPDTSESQKKLLLGNHPRQWSGLNSRSKLLTLEQSSNWPNFCEFLVTRDPSPSHGVLFEWRTKGTKEDQCWDREAAQEGQEGREERAQAPSSWWEFYNKQ